MLTQQTFDTCIFHLPSLLQAECLVVKWHNQCMNIQWCSNTVGQGVYSEAQIFSFVPLYMDYNNIVTNLEIM